MYEEKIIGERGPCTRYTQYTRKCSQMRRATCHPQSAQLLGGRRGSTFFLATRRTRCWCTTPRARTKQHETEKMAMSSALRYARHELSSAVHSFSISSTWRCAGGREGWRLLSLHLFFSSFPFFSFGRPSEGARAPHSNRSVHAT